jgi:hypothetical protein
LTLLPARAQTPPPSHAPLTGPASAEPAPPDTTAAPAASARQAVAPASARPTPCQVATPSAVTIYWPRRITIPPNAAANFKRYNGTGYGSLIVVTRYDGSVMPLIPAVPEINPALRTVLNDFAHELGSRPTVACGKPTGVFVVRFYVPSGRIYHFEIPPPSPKG